MYETTAPQTIAIRDAVLVEAAPSLESVLERYFGFSSFRPLQEQIIADTLAGRDVLALMPTGGGKSLCYQLPALVRPGLTVVVSPLIALMKDQADFLRGRGIETAVLNSTLPPQQMQQVIDGLDRGAFRLLYVAPERLMQPFFLTRLARWNVAMFAIDEAHCISDWGHDFRPEYRQLVQLRTRFPDVPMMALTATATPRVREDIVAQLGFRDPGVYVASFNRPNLSYRIETKQAPFNRLREFIEAQDGGSGIVYCHTRRQTETLAQKLNDAGIRSLPYHAGLETPVRAKHQEAFLEDRVQVICATVAFGMGINKANIRYVVHYDIPKNIESYYQETGRAGRDGVLADCLLLFGKADVFGHERRIDEKTGKEREIARAQLKSMVEFAESRDCRRKALLAYFAEEFPGANCGSCDNCGAVGGRDSRSVQKSAPRAGGAQAEVDANAPLEDRTDDARKFISCLAEIIAVSRFSVGITHVTDVLYGSASARIEKFGHAALKTYGSGKATAKIDWAHVGKELVRLGYLAQRPGDLPVLSVTERGQALLHDGAKVQIRVRAGAPSSGACDPALFEVLRRLRSEISQVQDIPAYMVFADTALKQMAREYPTSAEAFSRISGVGERKLNELGPAFMDAISNHVAANGKATFDTPAAPAPVRKPLGDSEYETLRRFRAGESVAQIARDREIKETTALGHLSAAAEAGESIPLERFLSPDNEREVGAAFGRLGWANLTGVHESLGGRYDFGVLRIFRAHRSHRTKAGNH